MFIQTISAFFATIFFSIMFNIAKKELVFCGIGGALAWFVYLCVLNISSSPVIASFFGALVVGLFSRILSRVRKVPVTIFLISGIIPLVPGAGMYRTMFAIISQDLSEAAKQGVITLQIAGVIAMAMVMISSWPHPNRRN